MSISGCYVIVPRPIHMPNHIHRARHVPVELLNMLGPLQERQPSSPGRSRRTAAGRASTQSSLLYGRSKRSIPLAQSRKGVADRHL